MIKKLQNWKPWSLIKFAALKNTNPALIAIFGVALSSRMIIAIFQATNGIQPISWFPVVQTWDDFYLVYGRELVSMAHGSFNYFGIYTYTPLFIYSLFPFYLLHGTSFASLPILVADAATAPLIYLNVRSITNERVAIFAGLCYALSPFMLIMEAYLWLSSQPMFFFMILAVYLLRRNKPVWASFAIGISVMFKQEALFILPAFATWYLAKYKRSAWKGAIVFLTTLAIISLPFLLTTPTAYLGSISYGLLSNFLPKASATLSIHAVNGSSVGINSLTESGVCSSVARTPGSTVSLCPFGYVTYSTVQTGAIWPYGISGWIVDIVQWTSQLLDIPVFILVGFILFLSRKRSNLLELGCAYSTIGSLLVFSIVVHGLLTYYFLPVYGLLFASSREFRTVLIVALATFVSLFVTDGPFQAVLPLLAISIILAINNKQRDVLVLKPSGNRLSSSA